jgi:spoIIIJ-associated protein
MSPSPRRIFWGHSLAQAVARAARHYGLAVERLAYRVHAKRHGFVKHPRKVLIEVDPAAPALAAPPSAETAPAPAPVAAAPPSREPSPSREPRPPAATRRPARASTSEPWQSPDEESALAAAEAAMQLLRFAGLALEPQVSRGEERLEIELAGADLERLRRLGAGFLDELEQLLPRAVVGLSGRRVRLRIDGAGLRGEREAALRARAREAAERLLAGGESELFEPLPPAERRILHLELAAHPGVETESVGDGFLKRLRIHRPAGG